MNIKLGYYPVLDMLLAFRQIYSGERFKPFSAVMETIDSKLNDSESTFIMEVGDISRGWLNIIEAVIDTTLWGAVSAEEFMLGLYNEEIDIFKTCSGSYDYQCFSTKLSTLWQNYFISEGARSSRLVFEKSMELNRELKTVSLKDYLLKATDRIVELKDGNLKVLIKPEHIIELERMDNVIIMPSVFACRSMTFWNSGKNYVFYISIDMLKEQQLEPSDMLLLKASALSDKTRLKMLRLLYKNNCTTADMAEALNMNPSTVSRHFKLFKDAGFVDIFTQEGNFIYYSLNMEEIKKSYTMLSNYIQGEE